MPEELAEMAEASARGGFFLFTGNALSLVTLAVGSIIVARLLGPENYGLFALALVVPSILGGLIDLGVNPALTRFSARLRADGESELAASILRSGFLFKLISGIAASATCFIFSDVFAAYILNRPEIGFLIKLTSLLIVFQTVFNAQDAAFIGLDRMEGSAVIRNVQAVAKTALSPLLVVLGFAIAGALTGHIISVVIAGLVGSLILFKLYRGFGRPSSSFSSSIKVMLSYGLPLYASSLLGLFLGQYQTIILAFFTSNAEIGNFSIAANLSSLISVLVFPMGVLFPAFSKVDPDSAELKSIFKLSVKYTAMLIVPATVIVAVLSRDIVYTLYGDSYGLGPLFLQLYILTFLSSGFGSVVIGNLFQGIGETRVVFRYSLINVLVFLPLAPVFAVAYHVPGLIIASLTSSLFSLAYALFIVVKKIKLSLDLKASLRIYLASSLSAVPVLGLLHVLPLNNALSLAINGPVFLLTYLTILPLTKAIDQTDLQNFKLMFSKLKVIWPLLKPVLAYEAKLASTFT